MRNDVAKSGLDEYVDERSIPGASVYYTYYSRSNDQLGMDGECLGAIHRVMSGENWPDFALKGLLIVSRDNFRTVLHHTLPLHVFARHTITGQTIRTKEVTFALQYLSLACTACDSIEDVRELLIFIQELDAGHLTENGKIALYILVYNLVYRIAEHQHTQFREVVALEISPEFARFIAQHDYNGLQDEVLNRIFSSDRFQLRNGAQLTDLDRLQQEMVTEKKLSTNVISFAVASVCELIGLNYASVRLPELGIPLAEKDSGVFATEEDIQVFRTQRAYIESFASCFRSFIPLESADQFEFIASAVQLLQQQSLYHESAFDKKLLLETGAGALCMTLLLVAFRTQPPVRGRFRFCGFGHGTNGIAPQLRISLLYTLQNIVFQNPIALEWLGEACRFDVIIAHQLGDGETLGCEEIVSLLLNSCTPCKSCVKAIHAVVSQTTKEYDYDAEHQ